MSHEILNDNKNILIISFAGLAKGMGNSTQFEFVNFLEKHFCHTSRIFYMDVKNKWYHCGIENLSTNIEETVNVLKEQIKNFKKVIFIGSSCGGYAAILFGSLLNIDIVIAFKPQTIVPDWVDKNYIKDEFSNLNKHINNVTKYYIYADTSVNYHIDPFHHISQCENIKNHSNVFILEKFDIDLRIMRDNGELLEIFNKHINLIS